MMIFGAQGSRVYASFTTYRTDFVYWANLNFWNTGRTLEELRKKKTISQYPRGTGLSGNDLIEHQPDGDTKRWEQ